jgi:hypothetical protein
MSELPQRLLRDALRDAASTAPSGGCVDAAALAEWADGSMSGPSRAAFESHAADCARCQALMAAMARSEPPVQIHAAWWRRSPFSWLMPLAAAAAAVVIVVVFARTEREAPVQQARAESPAAAPVAPSVTKAAPPAPAPSAAAPVIAPAPVSTRADSRRARAVRNEPTQPQRAAAPVAAEASPPASAKPAAAGAAMDRVAEQRALKAAVPAPMVIASPDHDSQWRIADGAIEHTADGGRSWQSQPSGVTAPIRAGAAPAARVCWLVGARGLVMLTTDGLTWRRIEFPDPADLVAIQAIDSAQATVTTATGRSYVTSDGGTTWTIR